MDKLIERIQATHALIARLEKELEQMLPGVYAKYKRCGKPGCRVCQGGLGHGPYYYRYAGKRDTGGGKKVKAEVYLGRKIQGSPVSWSQYRAHQRQIEALRKELKSLLAELGERTLQNEGRL